MQRRDPRVPVDVDLHDLQRPPRCRAISSSAGATARHGPHQGAQKSTSTGIGESSTTARHVASVPTTARAEHLLLAFAAGRVVVAPRVGKAVERAAMGARGLRPCRPSATSPSDPNQSLTLVSQDAVAAPDSGAYIGHMPYRGATRPRIACSAHAAAEAVGSCCRCHTALCDPCMLYFSADPFCRNCIGGARRAWIARIAAGRHRRHAAHDAA